MSSFEKPNIHHHVFPTNKHTLTFGTSHLHGNTKTLHHFICSHTNHMNSNYLFFFSGTYNLHQCLGLVVGIIKFINSIKQIGKLGFVYLDIVLSIFGNRLRFRHATTTCQNARIREKRNTFVRDFLYSTHASHIHACSWQDYQVYEPMGGWENTTVGTFS